MQTRNFSNCFRGGVIVALLSLFLWPRAAGAIGVSPSVTVLTDVINGTRWERKIQLSRSGASEAQVFSVTVEGEGAQYIELPQATVTMAVGQKTAEVAFVLAPRSAANGQHTAILRLLGAAAASAGGGGQEQQVGANVGIMTGVIAQIKFSVSDNQIKAWSISQAYVEETEVGVPLLLTFMFENTGNVDARPDKIVVRLTDVTDPAHEINQTISGADLAYTGPQARQSLKALVTELIPQGDYNVTALFYDGERVVFSKDKMYVRIHPPGTLAQRLEFSLFESSALAFAPNELIKFKAQVKNSGAVAVEPILYVEIKSGEKTLDLLRSEAKRVFKGQSTEYLITYRLNQTGHYRAEAYLEYGVSKSELKTIDFVVAEPGLSRTAKLLAIGGGTAVLVGLGGVVWLILRRRRGGGRGAGRASVRTARKVS